MALIERCALHQLFGLLFYGANAEGQLPLATCVFDRTIHMPLSITLYSRSPMPRRFAPNFQMNRAQSHQFLLKLPNLSASCIFAIVPIRSSSHPVTCDPRLCGVATAFPLFLPSQDIITGYPVDKIQRFHTHPDHPLGELHHILRVITHLVRIVLDPTLLIH